MRKDAPVSLAEQWRGTLGVLVVFVGAGLGIVFGWKFRQTTYERVFQELLARGQVLEPVIRPLLLASAQESNVQSSPGKIPPDVEGRKSAPADAASLPAAVSWSKPYQTIQELCRQIGRASQTRVTVILPNGTVLGESEEKPDIMEPHGTRPEIAQALQGQNATELRYSHTLRQWMFYAAVPVRGVDRILGVVRVSVPKTRVDDPLHELWFWTAGVCAVFMAAAWGIGVWWGQRLTEPGKRLCQVAERLAGGDWNQRISPQGPAEFRHLAEYLHQLAELLQGRHQTLQTQQSELEAILASMSEGVLAVDGQQRVLSLNRSAAELLGVEEAEGEGRPLQEISRHPELNRLVVDVLAQRQPIVRQMQLAGPPVREVQIQGRVLRDADDRPMGALVVLTDVTRLRQLENLRRDFVANVSHELKTPLTSIQGFVETLLEGALENSEQSRRFLKIIADQTHRLQNLLEDLLSLSRIEQEAEKQQIHLEPGPILPVLQSAMDICQSKAEAKRIHLELTCPEELAASRNPALLEQAVVNLLDNAIKYSPDGGRVELEAAQEGQELVIRVRDYGCGIPPEHLDRIFERFYRVDKARSRKLGGTGLGLAIVKHIALAHGGRVAVQSQVDRGSVFSIYLPLQAKGLLSSPPEQAPMSSPGPLERDRTL